jgi:hypothetical protein
LPAHRRSIVRRRSCLWSIQAGECNGSASTVEEAKRQQLAENFHAPLLPQHIADAEGRSSLLGFEVAYLSIQSCQSWSTTRRVRFRIAPQIDSGRDAKFGDDQAAS